MRKIFVEKKYDKSFQKLKAILVFKQRLIKKNYNYIKKKEPKFNRNRMKKSISFKINKPKISLVLQSKGDKENLKTKKNKEEISIMPENCLTTLKENINSQKMRRSKSMLYKQNKDANIKTYAFNINLDQKIIAPTSIQDCTTHQTEYITKDQKLKKMLAALIEILSKKELKFQPLKSMFIVEKSYFTNIISYLFALLQSSDHVQCHSQYKQLQQIKGIYESLFIKHVEVIKAQRRSRLQVKNKVFTMNQPLKDSHMDQQTFIIKSKETICVLNDQIEKLSKTCQIYRQQIKERSDQLTTISKNVQEMKTKELLLLDSIQRLQQRLSNSQNQEKNIVQYINTQRNQCVKMAGEDYKRIEADIYEYASYLQANVLASDLNYQPHPYEQIQTIFKAKFHEIQVKIDKQGQRSSNSAELSQFTRKLLNYIDKKDIEINKLLQFKTKSIKKFINHMKMWLDNWSLKQQYLGNLRKQFAYNTCILQELFDTIKYKEDSAQNMEKLRQSINKLQTLYKLGNSFY